MDSERTLLVTGATGLQGGAVARRLLRDGWRVRALTRDPASARARDLAALGAVPVAGDLEDLASLAAACAGAHGVFSVQDFWAHGYEAEIRQGGNLVDAAKAAGVAHFVYASVGGATRTAGLGITHFETKAQIERRLIASGLAYTIFRPVSFLENFTQEAVLTRMFQRKAISFPFPGDRPFQLLAIEDEADLVAAAFRDPGTFLGRAIEIASDERSLSELAELVSAALGEDIGFREVPLDQFAAFAQQTEDAGLVAATKVGPSLVPQLRWNQTAPVGGWAADIDAVRRLVPTLRSLEAWVASIDWAALRQAHAPRGEPASDLVRSSAR
ncbi:MAG: NmrA/HSCARG family protein [Caulobacterales bacterium]|nr:NmrA/HSCARG family protein [Caulobacterales bacterium]